LTRSFIINLFQSPLLLCIIMTSTYIIYVCTCDEID